MRASPCSTRGSCASSSSSSPSRGSTSSMRRSTKRPPPRDGRPSRGPSRARAPARRRPRTPRRARRDTPPAPAAGHARPGVEHLHVRLRASSRWCSCWPQRSTVDPTRPPARGRSPCGRSAPRGRGRRRSRGGARRCRPRRRRAGTDDPRPRARGALATMPASARSPTSSLMEESSARLAAPVSPVSTVRPGAGSMAASPGSARRRERGAHRSSTFPPARRRRATPSRRSSACCGREGRCRPARRTQARTPREPFLARDGLAVGEEVAHHGALRAHLDLHDVRRAR